MNTYEVQKFGVTLFMAPNLREAEDTFKKAERGEVVLYHIVAGKKQAIKRK